VVAILVMAPAIWTFVKFIQQSGLESDYNNFLKTEVESNNELWLQKGTPAWEEKSITLYFNGEVPEATIADLTNEIKNYEKIKDFTLNIKGNKNRSFDKISEAYDRAIRDLDSKDNIIAGLQKQITELQENITVLNQQIEAKTNGGKLSFTNLSRDAKVRFKDLEYFGYSRRLESKDFINIDTVSVVNLKWNKRLPDSTKLKNEIELRVWLTKELKQDSILILR
jgi:hypothetical protein